MIRVVGAPTLDDALAVLRERVQQNEAKGEKNLVFCEDRLTLLAERGLIENTGGTFLTEVSTFARFLRSEKNVLSKQGSIMAISAIISSHEKELQCFHKNSANAVYETLAQLSASRVTAQDLRLGANETEGTLRSKLCDLAFLLERYQAFLQEKEFVDESGYLELLPSALRAANLQEVNVFFFVFPSFTRQARESVRVALEEAKSATGIFLAGREDVYTNEGARIFRRIAEEAGETSSRMVKSSMSEDAARLCESISSPERSVLRAEEKQKLSSVCLFEEEDETAEFHRVASLIKMHVARGMRYRDVAVLAEDKEQFLTLEKVFHAYQIPFYADRKRALSAHPFSKLILAVLEAVASGCLPDDVDAILRNFLFGESDEYRNYLLKFGSFRGGAKREIKEGEAVKQYDREGLVACRERLLSALECFPKKGKGRDFIAGIQTLKERFRVEEVCNEFSKRFIGAEEEFLQISSPSPFDRILLEMQSVVGEETLTAREFFTTFKSGLEALEVSMIPQFLDAVFVGDCTESKFARVKILFATGMTDALPRTHADTAVITDGDVKRLSALSVEIEPAIAQINARAKEALVLNLCAFENALYMSYPTRKKGEETRASEIYRDLKKEYQTAPVPEVFPYDCSERQPALLRLTALKEGFENGEERSSLRYSALYSALSERGESENLRRLFATGEKQAVPQAEQLYFSRAISPTLLENYFACPYAGFMTRGLRLREREERTVLDTDAGTFVHAVLESAAQKFNEFQTEEECRAYAKTQGENFLKTPRFAPLLDTKAGSYTAERLLKEGEEVSCVAYRQLAQSAFTVKETEGTVRVPELKIEGKTDRIDTCDEYVRVIDYKTGMIDETPTAYYTGRKLQLGLYLLGASQGGKPAAAFYFPAADEFHKEGESRYKMQGFWCGEDEVLTKLDVNLKEGEKSELFDGKRDNKFSERGMSAEDFEAFLTYSKLVSAQAEKEMKEGNVAPSPYKGVCEWCKLKGACAFTGVARECATVKCSDVVKIVKKERGEL